MKKKFVKPKRKVLKVSVTFVEEGHEDEVWIFPRGRNYKEYGNEVIEILRYLFDKEFEK